MPSKAYKLPASWLKEGCAVINVSTFKNVDEGEVMKVRGRSHARGWPSVRAKPRDSVYDSPPRGAFVKSYLGVVRRLSYLIGVHAQSFHYRCLFAVNMLAASATMCDT